MNKAINFLQVEISPLLDAKSFNQLEKPFTNYCFPTHLDYIICFECHETCIRDVFEDDKTLFYDCPTGSIEMKRQLEEEDIKRFRFAVEKLLKHISLANNINYYHNSINDKSVLFGEKTIQGINYKFFYCINLIINNSINENIIYGLRSWILPVEKAVILTPQNCIFSNKDLDFLNANHCMIIELDKMLKGDFIIKQFITSDLKDIETLVQKKKLVVINQGNTYFSGYKFSTSPKPFELLRFLALYPEQNISKDTLIEHLWGNETKDISFDKQLYNHKSALIKSFKKAYIPKELYTNIIKLKNDTLKLNVSPSDIYVE